jgi:hypothetical protein
MLFKKANIFGILSMHQIKIKIVHTAGFQLTLKERPNIRLFFEKEIGQFIGENVAVTGIAAGKTLSQGSLAFTVQVAVGGVKIIESRRQESVYHLTDLGDVHFFALHGQAHGSKAKALLDMFHKLDPFPYDVSIINEFVLLLL